MSSWQADWQDLPSDLAAFWRERHLCTLTTLRSDGRPHVVPVGVALDLEQQCAWVITSPTSRKARNLTEHRTATGVGGRVAACQVDGARWSTLEGTATVLDDPASVARAVEQYAARYRQPRENPSRVAIRIEVDRILSSRRI
ncbi:pyridoxamine 5'-phosphate oxidase family protein [Nocardioides sp.]|uniref:pyridoxamine 5'-phosphate oxidase family protein n=1 Tax=Nocardioides sp. TaxID=35761 RepID=UPI0035664519